MFYLLIIPVLVSSAFMIHRLRKIKKHDKVLFHFCQIRRDAMELLRNNYSEMTIEEYRAIRRVLMALNSTIHDYNDYKISIFNFRRFYRMVKNYKKTTSSIERMKLPKNSDIGKLLQDFSIGMIKAFFAYTPFLKSEIIFKLVILILDFVTKSGIKYLNDRARVLLESLSMLEKQSDKLGYSASSIHS